MFSYIKCILIGILLLALSGCAMDRGIIMAIQADGVKPTLGSSVPVQADSLKMVIFKRTALGEKTSEGKLDEIIKSIVEKFGFAEKVADTADTKTP